MRRAWHENTAGTIHIALLLLLLLLLLQLLLVGPLYPTSGALVTPIPGAASLYGLEHCGRCHVAAVGAVASHVNRDSAASTLLFKPRTVTHCAAATSLALLRASRTGGSGGGGSSTNTCEAVTWNRVEGT